MEDKQEKKGFFKTVKEHIMTILNGFIIGGTMLVPGVSGGTMAMLLGEYDKLLDAVGSFRKNMKRNILFLLFMAVGGCLGLLAMAYPLSKLLEIIPNPVLFFFVGVIAGGIPCIIRESQIKKFSWKIPFDILIGIACVMVIIFFMPNITGFAGSWVYYIILFIVGIFISVGLVLPGISTSHLLKVFGIHSVLMTAVKGFDFLFLGTLGLGAVIGIFLTTKGLDVVMKKFPTRVYMIILGFVAGSLYQLFQPETIDDVGMQYGRLLQDLPFCIIALAVGFLAFWGLSKIEEKHGK
ncbi:MAG: DUF368 domain-containing protein [Ruminococcaceae bacterium]|nr:DUF368 domain-containing protein [Oscillospiraceae bacterium]